MSLRRHCRNRRWLGHRRICGIILLLFFTPILATEAEKQPVPIFFYQSLRLDLSGCAAYDSIDNHIAAIVSCLGDTLRPGVDYERSGNRICLTAGGAACDSLIVITKSRRVLSLAPYSLRPYVTTQQAALITEPIYAPSAPVNNRSSNLNISGTKSFYADVSDRGNTTLGQGLTMSVTGDIGHDILVRGSFADRGMRDSRMTTKRFSELENVYLEVESPTVKSVFGNFQLQQRQFELTGFQRNVQGLQLAYTTPQNRTDVSISVPQGNYVEYEFATSDGDYGPYRLKGKDGELGIAVVENSDAVWINGDKLQRGRDQDYYIDYLRGELYFTSRRIIDAGDRVRTEYEFQRLEYRKTLIAAVDRLKSADSSRSLSFGYTGFLTAGNDPIDFSLSEEDKSYLAQAGDNPEQATIPGAKFVGAAQGSYLIETDSLRSPIYRFVGEKQGDYQVSFSEVDSGDYSYLGAGWYQYVGAGKGRYLPVRKLPMPENVNLVSASGVLPLAQGLNFSGETAVSNYDRNRLSGIDDNDNSTIAGLFGAQYSSPNGTLKSSLKAEIIPNGFPKISRLDGIEDRYLWQSNGTAVGGRRRFLGELQANQGKALSTSIVSGYQNDESGFVSRRANIDSKLIAGKTTTGRIQLNLASSNSAAVSRRLFDLRPEIRTTILPVTVNVAGEYDRRSSLQSGGDRIDSKREIESSLSIAGISLGGRWRENWIDDETGWSLNDRKRSAILAVVRTIRDENKIDAAINVNRFSQNGHDEDYQTGSMSLIWPNLIPAASLSANYRLNRRGYSQTNQTYLRVDNGEGDYVLIDSVYVAQPRGDYILVTEHVGEASQSIEAEKSLHSEFELEKVIKTFATRGTTLRYEMSIREIGTPDDDFSYQWFVPSKPYFDASARLSQRKADYRLRRYDRTFGLSSELSYTERRDENNLEVIAPSRRNSDEIKLSLSKSFAKSDNAQLSLSSTDRDIEEFSRVHLNLRERRAEISFWHFLGPWEFNLATMYASENSDSLDLLAHSIRISPGVNYRISSNGRVEFSTFVLSISEWSDRPLFIQMAGGYPIGTHTGARLRVDIGISDNFSFKVTGQGEFRQHDEDRYYLRSELVSSFK